MYNNYQNDYENANYNMNFNQEPQKNKKKGKAGKKVALLTTGALLFGVISGAGFQGVQYVANLGQNAKLEQSIETTTSSDAANLKASNTSSVSSGGEISDVVDNVMPSIISIDCSLTSTVQDFFGRQYEQESSGSGSGIIIGQNNSELLIVTNNHVVAGDNTKVSVTFHDGNKVDAAIKGTDSTADLAVLSIKLDSLSQEIKDNIKIATLGNSDNVKVGEIAIAIGNALGYGQSVTVGYISAKDREVAMEDSAMKLLQTDAAINPGNSGGALLNAAGEVIGINSVKYASEEVEGMGYAIPISDAVPIIHDLMNREQLSTENQAYLGIMGEDVTESYAQRFHMPEGIYIGQVSEGSPAEKAGLKEGNIIVSINKRAVKNMDALGEILTYTKAGETADIGVKVLEDGEYVDKTISVVLGSKKDAKQSIQQDTQPNNEQDNNNFRD